MILSSPNFAVEKLHKTKAKISKFTVIQCVYVQEQRDHLRNLEIQKNELNNVLKSKRTELQRIRDETEAEDEVLQV